ncbi:plasmid mobilization protein [Streptomyces sp. 4N509B]|uniref:plasmid mobilization protein n=1 Tax=Streptomyces sp. 4N509B TaxID=3457413 RepID=UPI003FD0F6B7
MATKRFSISTSAEIHELIRKHAEASGLDVSAYMVASALERVTADDRVKETFSEIDAEIAAAEDPLASPSPDDDQVPGRLSRDEEQELDMLRSLVLDDEPYVSGDAGAAA